MSAPRHLRPRKLTPRRVLVAVTCGAGVLVAAAAFVLWPRAGTPVSEEEAVEAYSARGQTPRARGAGPADGTTPATAPSTATAPSEQAASPAPGPEAAPSGPAAAAEVAPLGRPVPGVYSYPATGSEQVRIGPASQTRPMSETVTATVTGAGDCWTFEHDLFAEHSETTEYCAGAGGSLTSPLHTKTQRIAVMTANASMRCDPGTVLPEQPVPGRQWSTSCSMQTRTPIFTASTTQQGTVTVVGVGDVHVGADTVPAWHVQVRRRVDGDLSGHWHEDIWFSSRDATIVRIERDAQLAGPATFTERSTFQLRSLRPKG